MTGAANATTGAQGDATPSTIYLNRPGAASYIVRRFGIPMTADGLAQRARSGNGPPYRIWGSPRGRGGGRGCIALYRPADLDAWVEQNFHDALPAST